MSFRESTVVIIETGRTVVRAGIGLHELLKIPAVQVDARVGLVNEGGETSGSPLVTDYLVGSQLNEAIAAGQNILISWPFADGNIKDWTQAEAIWKHVLFKQLGLRRVQNESPVLLSAFSGLPRSTYERICQMFFERFNVAGFGILERPRAQLYSTTSLTGVVVDIGWETTDISPIYENLILQHACVTASLGMKHCQNYLAHLLRSNQSVMSALSPPESPLSPEELETTLIELVKQIWEEGHIKVPSSGETLVVDDEGITDIAAIVMAGKEKAVIESGMKKKATAKASAAEQARAREIEALDLLTVHFRGKSLTLGKERHRFCEPLFDPGLLKTVEGTVIDMSLQEAAGLAVRRAEVDQRRYIWEGLFVTGDITTHVKGIGIALRSRLSPYIVINPELHSDVQPRTIQVLNLPDYYPEYRDTGEGYAAFLGSSIVAKLIFHEMRDKSYVSKADYSQKGPHCVIEMSPSLL